MGKVKVDKTYTKTKTYKSPKTVDGKLSYTLYNDKGENVGQTLVDPGTDMSVAQFNYFTKGDDGYWHMSETPNTNITLNTETGNIQITAPKSITETDQFKQFIDEDKLKKYSQAYKTNKDYKLSITEKNEETGEEEEKEVTIPEYIERLNSSLTNYVQNLRSQKIYGYQLGQMYGDKASNLTDAQIIMSAQGEKGAKATYLPDTILSVGSFGNGISNPFKKLKDKRGENGEISAEDLEEVWTRNNFGREEVAAIMATINGHLEGSNWNKDTYYKDADGNEIYNRTSAEEAAKLIAFKNYVLNNNPHAEWYQQAGDWIESAAVNFGTAFTNVFANLAVMGEGAIDMLPGVEAKSILNWKNENDETIDYYNTISAQSWDALVNAQIWGYLAGAISGSMALGWLGGEAASALQKEEAITYTHIKSISEEMASKLGLSGAAAQALTPQTMAQMFNGGEYAALGTRLWLNGLTAANRSLAVTNATLSAISGAVHANIATEYLFDTLHDAIVFDGSTLRNVIEAVRSDDTNENRQKVVSYWMDQFAQNALFWAPLGAARTGIKLAGKTTVGKAANAVLTKFINKVSSAVGYKKMSIRDKLANGSVVKKLESDIEKAIDDNKMTKAMRLQRKLDIENWNSLTRDARKRLGNLELKWEDGQLTPLSLYEFRSYVNDIKVLENGIDAYNRNIVSKIDEYTVKQVDPSTGMRMYLNPDLGETNARVTMYYWDLVDLTKKHNLPIAKDSLLNQDVIDYWMNSFYKRLADRFADSDGLRALDAQNAAVILQKNLDSLENVVPDEIKTYINNMLDRKVYQNWYMAQNEYGMAKGLLNRDKTIGYQENPIWAEVGYMPIKVQHDVSGKWIPDDGRIDAVIEQDWDSLKFKVAEGQHYADPELVRQSRLRKLAQAEVSKDLFKAYKGFTNSATNVVKITGDQTRYVNTIKGNVEALDTAIDDGAANAFKENFTVRPQLDNDKKLSRNIFVPEDTSATVTAGMSPSQTADFLVQKKILDGPNAKLTDKVTIDNYDDWFRQQSTPVQKYLTQKYSELDIAEGTDLISEELPMANNVGYSRVIATNEDYPGWDIGNHPVWALDESSTDFDGMTRRDYYRKVKGKEFRVIEMPSSDYNKVMMEDNIGRMLSSSEMKTANSYVDKFRNGERADIPFIQYDKNGKIIGQEGRHRTIAAHKAGIEKTPVIIEYPTGSKLPENLRKYKDVTDNFVLGKTKPGTDLTEYRVISKPYKAEDILSGKVGDRTRAKLAWKAAAEMTDENGKTGRVVWRYQTGGSDRFYDVGPKSYLNLYQDEEGLKDAARISLGRPKKYSFDDPANKNLIIFPVKESDFLWGREIGELQRAAKVMSDGKIYGENALSLKELKKVLGDKADLPNDELKRLMKMDGDTLKKVANGDPRALLDVADKKVISLDVIDWSHGENTYYKGIYLFPDRNPELVREGIDAMAKVTGDIDADYPVSASAIRARNKKKLEKLINSKENTDFLNKIGWNKGVEPYQSSTAYGSHHRTRSGHYERIKANLDEINTLEELESLEVHELAHAAWDRTTLATRTAVGQDLANILGLNIKVDDKIACSRAMNELVAHSMETRFQAKHGWDLLKNDKATKDLIKEIAGYAGLKPTEAFKDRVLTVMRSLVTFIKTKLLGINEAKTFDEFYYGLLNGDFADDLRKGLYEFSHYSPDDTIGSLPMQKNLKDIDVPGKKQTVKVSGGDVESSDVPVSMIPSKKTSAGETPQMSDEDFIQIASGENVRKIPVKKIQTPAESIFIDTGQPNSFALLERAISEGGDDFEAGLQRAYLSGDKSFRKTSVMNEAARNLEDGKEAFYQGVIMAKIKGETRNIPKLDVDAFWDEVLSTMRTQIDDYVARVTSSKGAMKAIETLAENSNGAEEAARYIALRQLKKKYMPDVKRIIMGKIDELKQLNKLEKGDVDLLKKKAKFLFNDVVDTELDDATNVARVINSELVDSKDIYDKVKALSDEIKGAEAKKVNDYIMYLNDNGDQVFAQVDPAFASLYNTRAKVTKSEASAMAKFNAFTSRAFRYGTTSVNLSAFGNQMFRDFGNAVLVGGAWQTIKTNADNLRDVFGDSIVEQIKTFDPDDYELRQVAKIAEQSGQTVQQAAVSRELMRGSAIAGTTTETSLYRDFMKQAYGEKSDDILNRAEGKLKELWKKYDPDKYMNGKRENYLRNRVYAHSLNDALNEGYTLAQARTYAEFAMNNATTNFSRQLYHMQAIADSTPYFRATINGTKSFWRMWSLDPVGITGRIMGGLILPTMFLTGASLGSEENRKVYQNIPEYQKKDALVFVFRGEPVSIQIPQELSPVVSPFRQFVEYLYGANKNDFWELMSNDLLGFLPYDMTGFTAIDYDKMIDDPNFFDRTSRGFSRLFSQMAPVPLKSAYMIASGTDPYTGKWLRDPSYAYWNDETNSIEIMDEYQSDFAKMIAKLFPKMNPVIADKVVSGVVGTTGSNLLSDITSLVTEGPVEAVKGVGEHLFKQATNPVTVEKYDLVDAIWKRAVRQLTSEKNDILSSKEMVKLNNELVQTKDPEKRKKLLAERQNLTNEYKEKVAKMVERLSSEYEGSLDRKKFAAVVALLNFNSDAAYQAGSQYSSDIASEMYWNGRDEAIHTMERMGISGTSDMSIFGYLTTNREGEPVMKYSSPTAIMDMKSQWENQNDINAANIKALLSENNMYDAHKAVSDQISKIYDSKKKLTSQDKANIEAIQINWNAQLAKVIAPYVSQMTPEAAINNTAVMNLLYPYVEVPGSWETNDNGRSVYLGEKGNKKRAYYDSWIKSLFSVNDKYKGQY